MMKNPGKIALLVAMIAIMVLSIVVASVAWFTSNPEVDANDVTLNSARTLTVSFGPMNADTGYRYNGQRGNVAAPAEYDPDSDAPYVYETGGFTINLSTSAPGSTLGKVTVEFGSVEIVYPTGRVSNVLISDLFHITVDAYARNDSGTYVKDDTTHLFRAYDAGTDSGAARYTKAFTGLHIADDGVLMKTENSTPSVAGFPTGIFELTFTYTFLSEEGYQVWANASKQTPTADFEDICGYELAAGGEYIGVVDYVPYKAKYHYGLQRYSKSNSPDLSGNYTYTANDSGMYVRAIKEYLSSGVTLYRAHENTYSSSGEGEYRYIKIGDSTDYVTFNRFNLINGFPYSADKYRGETFSFTVCCTVEEMEVTP